MDKVWRIRIRYAGGYPPTYHGPFNRDEVREFLSVNFAKEQETLVDVNVTRGDHGGTWQNPAVDVREKAE